MRIIQKINQGSSSLFVEVGIVVLFINSNITKNKKTQKVKKLTFWVSGKGPLSWNQISIKKWFGEVPTWDVPLPVTLKDADVMYKAVKDSVQPRFSGDCLPSTWRESDITLIGDGSDVVTVQVNKCVPVLVNLNTCIVFCPVTATCNRCVHLCFNLSHGTS